MFCLKDIEQANVKKRFQDLNHKNTNVNAAYLLYQIITHYYETKPESTTINQMNSRLIDVTKSIINYFYFSGKINDLTLRQSSNPIKSELDKKYQQKVIKKHNKNIIDYYIKIVINLDLVHRDDDQFYMDPGFKEMLLNGLDMKEEYFLFLCNAGSRF